MTEHGLVVKTDFIGEKSRGAKARGIFILGASNTNAGAICEELVNAMKAPDAVVKCDFSDGKILFAFGDNCFAIEPYTSEIAAMIKQIALRGFTWDSCSVDGQMQMTGFFLIPN